MKVCPTCQAEYPTDVEFCPTDGTKLRTRREDTTDPLLGRALDRRWIIEEKLGEGGMGAVYKGHQRSVNRTVAIKTLRPQLVESEEFVDRFFREAQIAGNISHPHCVTILDYGESDDGTLFLAMEFLDGEELTERMENGSLAIKQVIEVGIQVASALSAAHEQKIVHRDLKPDNIFLIDVPGGATFAKVLDFGIAKMLDSNTQMTKTGMIFGTPEYMSPEQCRGGEIDGRSDLYSLGCILYEMVGGRTPFAGTTPMAVLMAHVNQTAPSLAAGETAAHVPPTLEQVIMKLLEKDPDRRYQSAADVREALEDELQRLDSYQPGDSQPIAPPPAQEAREVVADPVQIGFDETVGMESTGPHEPQRAEPPVGGSVDTFQDELASPPRSRGRVVAIAMVAFALVATASGAAIWLGTSLQEDEADPTPEAVATSDETSEPTEEPEATDDTEEPPAVAATDKTSDDEVAAASAKNDESDETTPARAVDPERSRETSPQPKKQTEPAKKAEPRPKRTPKREKAAKPKKTQKPKETTKPRKKRNKPLKDAMDQFNDDVEELSEKTQEGVKKETKKAKEGIDREVENALEGLMGD